MIQPENPHSAAIQNLYQQIDDIVGFEGRPSELHDGEIRDGFVVTSEQNMPEEITQHMPSFENPAESEYSYQVRVLRAWPSEAEQRYPELASVRILRTERLPDSQPGAPTNQAYLRYSVRSAPAGFILGRSLLYVPRLATSTEAHYSAIETDLSPQEIQALGHFITQRVRYQ